MPRASWSGFLRLSLVSCPIYLSPATTRTKSIPLHQVWRPAAAYEPEADVSDRDRDKQVAYESRSPSVHHGAAEGADQGSTATRIALRPHDPRTGEEIEKSEVVKGYEYGRGQFITFSAEELKALDVESSKVIDLETFVPRGDLDRVYFDTPYYLYPDGPIAVEALRVIGAAMTEAGVAGVGALPSAGASAWSWSSRAGPEWRCSHCALPTRSGQRSSAAPRAISMSRWWRSPARSSDSAPEHLTRARTATAIKRRCER